MSVNNPTAESLLRDLTLTLKDVSESIQFCREHQTTSDSETNVLATCLLEVLNEVMLYLDYFEDEIAKKLGLNNTSTERQKVYEEVFIPFVRDIKSGGMTATYIGRVRLVDQLISRWNQFNREDIRAILQARH